MNKALVISLAVLFGLIFLFYGLRTDDVVTVVLACLLILDPPSGFGEGRSECRRAA